MNRFIFDKFQFRSFTLNNRYNRNLFFGTTLMDSYINFLNVYEFFHELKPIWKLMQEC